MLLRRVYKQHRWLASHVKFLSTQKSSIDIKVDNDGVAILTLQRPPVNSFSMDFLKELSKSLDFVEQNKITAMILTSPFPRVFSAGLDINEVYKPDAVRFKEFWTTLQEVWMKLFGARFITAAAINGQSPAGGCLMAMSCEYRVMTKGTFTIGMNETSLGLIAPTWFMELVKNTINVRDAEYAFTTSRMFTPGEALKVRLIDEIATDKDDAIAKCKRFIKKFDEITPSARINTKMKLRGPAIKKLQNTRQEDTEEIYQLVIHPDTQKGLETYIQKMKLLN